MSVKDATTNALLRYSINARPVVHISAEGVSVLVTLVIRCHVKSRDDVDISCSGIMAENPLYPDHGRIGYCTLFSLGSAIDIPPCTRQPLSPLPDEIFPP